MLLKTDYQGILDYHLTHRGLYAELRQMFLLVIYAVQNKLLFQLHDDGCNYLQNGYEEFFKKFWPNMAPEYENLPRTAVRNHNDPNFVILPAMIDLKTLSLPEFGIESQMTRHQKITEATKRLYLLNDKTKTVITAKSRAIDLPEKYCGIHIRRGDKRSETILPSIKEYAHKYKAVGQNLPVFISTDDYTVVHEFEQLIEKKAYYFTTRQQRGHDEKIFNQSASAEDTYQILADVEMLSKSQIFIGTGTSNVSNFVVTRHKYFDQCYSVQDWELGRMGPYQWEEPGVWVEQQAAKLGYTRHKQ